MDTIMHGINTVVDFFTALFGEEFLILEEHSAISRMFVAALCGALVGWERERASKPAGLRTNILICTGSALFTLASILTWQVIAGAPATVDPGRIAAQIVTGVGFLGAGVVITTGAHVTGITTAATIWLVAAIGMVIGIGFPGFGLLTAVVAATTLFVLKRFETAFPYFPKEHED